jgi:hypothetical protein
MPDFEDPLTLTEDIDIYFDDIRLMHDPLTSTSELNASANLKVFPNPALDVITIHLDELIRDIQIFDLSGKLMLQSNSLSSEPKINLSGLSKGMYILKVNTLSNSYTHKINH